MLAFDHDYIPEQNSAAAAAIAVRPFDAGDEGRQAMPLSSPGKLALGAVVAEWNSFPTQRVVRIGASAELARVIVPIAGRALIVRPSGTQRIDAGEAALISEQDRMDCVWLPGSIGMTLHLNRRDVQERAFARHRQPRRIGSATYAFDCHDARSGFGAALVALSAALTFDFEKDGAGPAAIGHALIDGLVDVLIGAPEAIGVFPYLASVKRALDHLEAGPENIGLDDLARAAGITLPNLRRNVRDCTGMTLSKLLQDVQLDWARSRLSSNREARSIEQIAKTAGFGRAVGFTRAYRRRFGETPTQTRVRTFAHA